jgi:FixJ family two-component response regulator
MTEKTKILLIDDEELVREELGGLLEDEGYEVITGADGEEGLALFRSSDPDMVITDVRMPRRDGLSVAITIRQEDPTVPVTVITGHGNEAMAIQALRTGVTDFIKKPVRLDDLTSALSRMEAARRPAKPHDDEGLPETVELLETAHTYMLENDLSVVPGFVEHLLERCAADLDRVGIQELSLALRELVINAIEHGNLGVTFEEKSQAMESGDMGPLIAERSGLHKYMSRRVTVVARRLERRVIVHVADEGEGFDWHALPDPTDAPNLLSAHGRGILLARMSVDNMTFNEAGNEVTIEKLF